MTASNSAMAVDGYVGVNRESAKSFRKSFRRKIGSISEMNQSVAHSLAASLLKENIEDQHKQTTLKSSFESGLEEFKNDPFEFDTASDKISQEISTTSKVKSTTASQIQSEGLIAESLPLF